MAVFPTLLFAQLDWDDDRTVFSTAQHEWSPCIVAEYWLGEYRAFCVRENGHLSMRRTETYGDGWGQFTDIEWGVEEPLLQAAADQAHVCLAVSGVGASTAHAFRLPRGGDEWPAPVTLVDFVDTAEVRTLAMISDMNFTLDDTYYHAAIVGRGSDSAPFVAYVRSEDYGQSWSVPVVAASGFQIQDTSASVSLCVTWGSFDERVWIAVTQDRPGSIGEQVVLYFSDDLGATWSAGFVPDSSSYAQSHPSLAGLDWNLTLTYQRRNNTSITREIFTTYTPDNGTSWSEPLQLTDSPLDDIRPQLCASEGRFGLIFGRTAINHVAGDLLFRSTSLDAPWVWEPETMINEATDSYWGEGFSISSRAGSFAVAWNGRIVDNDGDVFFDGSWRGLAADDQDPSAQTEINFSQNGGTGLIEVQNLSTRALEIKLYDLLGRETARTTVKAGLTIWRLPDALPTGTYWAMSERQRGATRIQIVK
ncbi:MAG: exo-alpha-sialidase [bacterium]|nr:exo-alpha-sialidase [bacterium]